MPDLLLEIFSEEIPARMQAKAESDLKQAVTEGLKASGLIGTQVVTQSGPRRLVLWIEGLPARSADVEEERKGPKVGAPEKAVQGFLRGAGLADISEAEVRSDPKKGEFYVAVKHIPGRPAPDLIAELIPDVIAKFHWPKSMRTGRGQLRWVRPLQRILCLFDGTVVPFEIDGIQSGDETEGHRIHGRGPFKVTSFADYQEQLSGEGHVLLTRDARREKIAADAQAICTAKGLELVEDKGLLEEVIGLSEWPVVVLGEMDPAFLELPPEVIQLSMRTHQKYFAVRDPKTGALAPNFVTVANIAARDGGAAIAKGNRKVLSARLDDGRFFWENDKRTGLEAMAPKLSTIKFKDELGSIGDKVERVAALARELAPKVGADADLAERAARLAKADLVSEMVYEFPELQGVMGRYYCLAAYDAPLDPADQISSPASGGGVSEADGGGLLAGLTKAQNAEVANAIADHYKPQGPSDPVPTDPVSIAVALADKLDTLVGFWAIDEKPTGSKDPFALRRAALGVVRIVLENGVRLNIGSFAQGHAEIILRKEMAAFRYASTKAAVEGVEARLKSLNEQINDLEGNEGFAKLQEQVQLYSDELVKSRDDFESAREELEIIDTKISIQSIDLLSFFADRLKQYLRDQGQRHDLIDAVFALGSPQSGAEGDRPTAGQAAPAQALRVVSAENDDLVLIVKRVEALAAFLDTEDGANLLTWYKRAANMLKTEEKKDQRAFEGAVEPGLLEAAAEKTLYNAITDSAEKAQMALAAEDFSAAMSALAALRAPVDAFFEGEGSVMVNAEDKAVRENRLNLLHQMRAAISTVADFSKIEG